VRADTLAAAKSPLSTDEEPTAFKYVTSYNNYYEFGTGKSDPSQNAHTLTTKPWTLKVDGLVDKPAAAKSPLSTDEEPTCFIVLLPLAATSSNLAIRRLGGKVW
jgi:hypothetical protein